MNPSSSAGAAVYRWPDLNGDHLAQSNEVQLNQFVAAANGFNPSNPTAVTSSNAINPDLKAPVTQSVVAGLDREVGADLVGAGELHLHADDEPAGQRDLLGDAARRRRRWPTTRRGRR